MIYTIPEEGLAFGRLKLETLLGRWMVLIFPRPPRIDLLPFGDLSQSCWRA